MPPGSQRGWVYCPAWTVPAPTFYLFLGLLPTPTLCLPPPAPLGNLSPLYLYWFSMALLSALSGTQE